MSDGRILVVTVGTSLFSSASWSYEGELQSVPGYRSWVEELLQAPSARRKHGAKTSEALEKLLRDRGTRVTADHFAADFDRPERYSGELTTLLRCSEKFGQGEESFTDFLRRSYREIQLLAATDVNNESHVAASHLQVILRDQVGHPNVSMPGSLRGRHLADLLDHLRRHLADLVDAHAEADLLVTGGYKAYSLLAGKFVASQPKAHNWRTLYIHEEDIGQLIVEDRGETLVEATQIPGTRWPSPLGEDG